MGWKYALASKILSRSSIDQLKTEPKMVRARLLCFSPKNVTLLAKLRKRKDLKLNLGCGSQQIPGWVPVDLIKTNGGLRWDLRWKLPFADGSVRQIHCEHFLEHLEYEEGLRLLKECARVLKTDGELRLIVPDAKKYIHAYVERDKRFWGELSDLGGGHSPFGTEMEIINQAFRMGGGHRFAYDSKTLNSLLQRAGFPSVRERNYAALDESNATDRWRLIESLDLVARKAPLALPEFPRKVS